MDLFIDAAAQTAPACGWEATVGRREAEHETETTPADRPQDFPATGRRAVKPGPPPPAGWRQPWDGGKRNMKPRPPLLRRKRRLWTFLVRPGRSRFHSAPETARQGRPRFQPAPKTARPGRPRFQPTPKTARPGRPRFQPAPETARQGRPRFQPAPKTARQGRPRFQPTPLEQRSGRAGADATAALGRAVGTCPAITPRTRHPACPLPLRPIGHWHRLDEVSHSPGMHTPLTPDGGARSCSRRVEVLRLARLLDAPAGSLRLTHRKTDKGRVCPRRVGSIHLVTNARTPTRAPPLDAPVDDRKHAHGRLRFQ